MESSVIQRKSAPSSWRYHLVIVGAVAFFVGVFLAASVAWPDDPAKDRTEPAKDEPAKDKPARKPANSKSSSSSNSTPGPFTGFPTALDLPDAPSDSKPAEQP